MVRKFVRGVEYLRGGQQKFSAPKAPKGGANKNFAPKTLKLGGANKKRGGPLKISAKAPKRRGGDKNFSTPPPHVLSDHSLNIIPDPSNFENFAAV